MTLAKPYEITGKVTTTGKIEIWLGEPYYASSTKLGEFDKRYLKDITKVFNKLNKETVLSLTKTYRSNDKLVSEYSQHNGFLHCGATKCPDCHVSLVWNTFDNERTVVTHNDGVKFYPAHCPKCKTHWEVKYE